MRKKDLKNLIDYLAIKGKLPLAFYNSEIIELKKVSLKRKERKVLIPKYNQSSIPRANSNKSISKIYELF